MLSRLCGPAGHKISRVGNGVTVGVGVIVGVKVGVNVAVAVGVGGTGVAVFVGVVVGVGPNSEVLQPINNNESKLKKMYGMKSLVSLMMPPMTIRTFDVVANEFLSL